MPEEPLITEKVELDDKKRLTLPVAFRKVIGDVDELHMQLFFKDKKKWKIVITSSDASA
jgi:DNA-binding transcriptional regulator/RsmH inhibitor MraZ